MLDTKRRKIVVTLIELNTKYMTSTEGLRVRLLI